ncbi:PREDICTED: ZW10 interactor isoform X5 [Myotis brandtii]|uniref:ZW10 interactor isoform X5 n=1 Tax=Myotis brandtii TaxID=109478 RepID=UPI000703F4BD|nr:PREDICTED: ZW10 interactor isoform X5 [Myotis brandtii]
MEAAETETEAEAAAVEALAKLANILEPIGLQEEAEVPGQILAEFVMDSRKKDKLLCSQLQVVDFLQNFLAQEDIVQGLDPLASEDRSRQKAIAAKEQWKELKATYQEHVEAISRALIQAMPKMEEAQRKQAQLREALEQLQAKKQVAMEKLRTAQKQWKLQQGQLQSPETEAELPQDLGLPEDKSQLLTQSREQTRGDTMGRDGSVSSKGEGLAPAGVASLP